MEKNQNKKKTSPSLTNLCIECASSSKEIVETWRRQKRTLERLPSHLADALFRRLRHRRLLYPSLLESAQNPNPNFFLFWTFFVGICEVYFDFVQGFPALR